MWSGHFLLVNNPLEHGFLPIYVWKFLMRLYYYYGVCVPLIAFCLNDFKYYRVFNKTDRFVILAKFKFDTSTVYYYTQDVFKYDTKWTPEKTVFISGLRKIKIFKQNQFSFIFWFFFP